MVEPKRECCKGRHYLAITLPTPLGSYNLLLGEGLSVCDCGLQILAGYKFWRLLLTYAKESLMLNIGKIAWKVGIGGLKFYNFISDKHLHSVSNV